jgi:hypothetical protein
MSDQFSTPPVAGGPSPNPTAAGILAGLALAGFLHLAVSLLVIMVGGAFGPDGWYAVFGFWIGLGLFQWIYLIPAARLSRSRRWTGITRGIWIAGGITLALNLLRMACVYAGPAIEVVTGDTPANVEYAGTDSRVVSADPARIVVREGLGDPAPPAAAEETFAVDSSTSFDFRGPAWRQQSRPAGPDWLQPGRRVNISYVFKNRRKTAVLVTIWVERPEP